MCVRHASSGHGSAKKLMSCTRLMYSRMPSVQHGDMAHAMRMRSTSRFRCALACLGVAARGAPACAAGPAVSVPIYCQRALAASTSDPSIGGAQISDHPGATLPWLPTMWRTPGDSSSTMHRASPGSYISTRAFTTGSSAMLMGGCGGGGCGSCGPATASASSANAQPLLQPGEALAAMTPSAVVERLDRFIVSDVRRACGANT